MNIEIYLLMNVSNLVSEETSTVKSVNSLCWEREKKEILTQGEVTIVLNGWFFLCVI